MFNLCSFIRSDPSFLRVENLGPATPTNITGLVTSGASTPEATVPPPTSAPGVADSCGMYLYTL